MEGRYWKSNERTSLPTLVLPLQYVQCLLPPELKANPPQVSWTYMTEQGTRNCNCLTLDLDVYWVWFYYKHYFLWQVNNFLWPRREMTLRGWVSSHQVGGSFSLTSLALPPSLINWSHFQFLSWGFTCFIRTVGSAFMKTLLYLMRILRF